MALRIVCLSSNASIRRYVADALPSHALYFGLPEEANILLNNYQPDIILVDMINQPNGVTLVDCLHKMRINTPLILVVKDIDNEEQLMQFLFAGAIGYVQFSHLKNTLSKAVEAVSQGQAWVPRKSVSLLIDTVTEFYLQRTSD